MSKKIKFVGVLTKEDVRKFREDLEKATKESFQRFTKASRVSWQKAKHIILD